MEPTGPDSLAAHRRLLHLPRPPRLSRQLGQGPRRRCPSGCPWTARSISARTARRATWASSAVRTAAPSAPWLGRAVNARTAANQSRSRTSACSHEDRNVIDRVSEATCLDAPASDRSGSPGQPHPIGPFPNRRASTKPSAIHPAVAFQELADKVKTEARLLETTEAELALHAKDRAKAYAAADPKGLARSLPGIGEVGAANLVAAIGRPGRFSHGRQVRSFCGLTPKSSETGETDRKGPAPDQGRPTGAARAQKGRPLSKSLPDMRSPAHCARPRGDLPRSPCWQRDRRRSRKWWLASPSA